MPWPGPPGRPSGRGDPAGPRPAGSWRNTDFAPARRLIDAGVPGGHCDGSESRHEPHGQRSSWPCRWPVSSWVSPPPRPWRAAPSTRPMPWVSARRSVRSSRGKGPTSRLGRAEPRAKSPTGSARTWSGRSSGQAAVVVSATPEGFGRTSPRGDFRGHCLGGGPRAPGVSPAGPCRAARAGWWFTSIGTVGGARRTESFDWAAGGAVTPISWEEDLPSASEASASMHTGIARTTLASS